MFDQWKALSKGIQLFVLAGIATLAVLAVWWFFIHPGQVRKEATIAKVDSAYSQAGAESAKDAVQTTQQTMRQENLVDERIRENNDAIDAAKGANAPVDPDVNSAGLRAQCLSKLYRDTPRCKSLLGVSS